MRNVPVNNICGRDYYCLTPRNYEVLKEYKIGATFRPIFRLGIFMRRIGLKYG